MYPIAWYVDAIKQTEMILTNIKIGTLLLSTKMVPADCMSKVLELSNLLDISN